MTGEGAVYMSENFGVEHGGGPRLLLTFPGGERLQRSGAGDVVAAVRQQQRLERVPDAAFPVDQRAVAVEGQGLEVGMLSRGTISIILIVVINRISTV